MMICLWMDTETEGGEENNQRGRRFLRREEELRREVECADTERGIRCEETGGRGGETKRGRKKM